MAHRISALTAEVLQEGIPSLRASILVAELIADEDPAVLNSQLVTEILADDDPNIRASQLGIEILYEYVTGRVSQLGAELLVDDDPSLHASELCLEVLYDYPMPPFADFTMSNLIFPALAGLQWDVKKSPQFQTTIVKHTSGRETRVSNYAHPLWKWEMSYELLRETQGYAELQALCGFFLARLGSFDTFLFADPAESNMATNYELGVGDGFTTEYVLTKSYAGFIEPVGYVDATTLQVFIGGVQVYSPATWVLVTPNTLQLTSALPAGSVISASYIWYYRVRFGEDVHDYNNFMYQLWELKKLTLEMVKP
jgi:uncharacterized protein (TIGR02217 family)